MRLLSVFQQLTLHVYNRKPYSAACTHHIDAVSSVTIKFKLPQSLH